jgi:HAMP domain-containing protein
MSLEEKINKIIEAMYNLSLAMEYREWGDEVLDDEIKRLKSEFRRLTDELWQSI